MKDEETLKLAQAFGVPVLVNSVLRDGSLRQAATENGTRVLLYEAGEALRFDELSIQAGVNGVRNVLENLACLKNADAASAELSRLWQTRVNGFAHLAVASCKSW